MLKELTKILNESVELNDNFWKWFNGSKIVDSEGNPLVCYHGSSNTFSVFDKELRGSRSGGEGSGVGFWFSTTPEYSKRFKYKMSVYLSIKNPKIFKSGNVSSEELKFEYNKYNNEKDSDEKYYIYKLIKGLSSRKDSYDHFLLDLYHSNNQSPIEQNFYGNLDDIVQLENKKQAYDNYVNKLKSEGYDGIIIVDTNYDKEKADGKNTQIVAFDTNQIKIISKEKLNESNDTFDRPYEREDDKSIPKIYQKRKKVLRLKDLNRLKKIRNQQREEMAQDSVFVPILYGPDMSQNEGGDMMGGGMPM